MVVKSSQSNQGQIEKKKMFDQCLESESCPELCSTLIYI